MLCGIEFAGVHQSSGQFSNPLNAHEYPWLPWACYACEVRSSPGRQLSAASELMGRQPHRLTTRGSHILSSLAASWRGPGVQAPGRNEPPLPRTERSAPGSPRPACRPRPGGERNRRACPRSSGFQIFRHPRRNTQAPTSGLWIPSGMRNGCPQARAIASLRCRTGDRVVIRGKRAR